MSDRSSTSTSHALYSGPLPLYRVAFEGERTAHWALFIPYAPTRTAGVLVHVGVEKQASSGSSRPPRRGTSRGTSLASNRTGKVEKYTLRWHDYPLLQSPGVRSAFSIANAFVTESQLRRAAEEVFNRKSYNLLTNNCQHFCIDVVTYLHQVYPQSVPRSAVEDVLARARGLTNISYMLRRTQLHEEGADAESDRGDRSRFSIE